jgi:hypothetical protein
MRALKYLVPVIIVAAIAAYEAHVEYAHQKEAENMCLSPQGKTISAKEMFMEHFYSHR